MTSVTTPGLLSQQPALRRWWNLSRVSPSLESSPRGPTRHGVQPTLSPRAAQRWPASRQPRASRDHYGARIPLSSYCRNAGVDQMPFSSHFAHFYGGACSCVESASVRSREHPTSFRQLAVSVSGRDDFNAPRDQSGRMHWKCVI